MAEIIQTIKPVKLQLDASEEYRDAFNAQFCANVRNDININSEALAAGNKISQGANLGNQTPIQSLELLCDIQLPEGENVAIGSFVSPDTKEIYWNVWNSLNHHSIWVHSTETGECRKVYEGECLNFRFEPQYHTPTHRIELYLVYGNENGERVIRNKFYVFTDGYNWQFMIDVESSIATDSYNPVQFPYFTTFYPYCDPCEFIQLGIRPPQRCPEVLPFDTDIHLQKYEHAPENNNLKNKVWYFATSFIDVFGRHSVMSPYSTAAFIDSGDCIGNPEVNKCFSLVLDAGSALVEKIIVYFSNDGLNWFVYDIIDKWDQCSPEKEFWQRDLALVNYFAPEANSPPDCPPTGTFSTKRYVWDLNVSPEVDFADCSWSIKINGEIIDLNDSPPISDIEMLALTLSTLGFGQFISEDGQIFFWSDFDVATDLIQNCSPSIVFSPTVTEEDIQTGDANTFIYQFCGNKQCIPVSPNEVTRYFDDLPITSIGLAKIDDLLSLGNNKRKYDNLDCLDKIKIETVQDEQPCETVFTTIKVRAVIHNFYDDKNNPIYQMPDSDDIAMGGFGNLNVGGVDWENDVISKYRQQIVNSGKGLLAGFRGTKFFAVSKQYQIGSDTPITMPRPINDSQRRSMMSNAYSGAYFYQEWEFVVPVGTYIFEIYSHLSDFDNHVGTSTYVAGTVPFGGYNPNGGLTSFAQAITEKMITVCDEGTFLYPSYFVIADLTKPKADLNATGDARAIAGYLKEKATNIPIELALQTSPDSPQITCLKTDHNGFYWGTSDSDWTIKLWVLNSDPCGLVSVPNPGGIGVDQKQLTTLDIIYDDAHFSDCKHEIITGKITDCNGLPLAGIPVILTQTGKFGVTDNGGNYRILAHDNAYKYNTGNSRKQMDADSLVISQQGACVFSNCSPSCDTCIFPTHVDWISSCFGTPACDPQTGVYNFTIDVISGTISGLKTGGNYEVSILGYDYLDRNNSAQLLGQFIVPTIQSNGIYAPYHFQWSLSGLLDLPSWIKKIRFAVRPNSVEFVLSWAINKVEFIDASGNITAPSIATSIRLYIDGLNNFINQNFTNTNAKYQFVLGDRIRFIANGDGGTFTSTTNNGLIDLPVSSLKDGSILIVPFDSRLTDLTPNATIELYRVPVCTTIPLYLEQCPSIPVLLNPESGTYEPIISSGTIPYFDTYWFFRTIPQIDKDGTPYIFVSQHRYEHHSPSDFWGDHLITFGRAFARDIDGRQTWHGGEIGVSDSLLQDGNINGLGTWRTEKIKDYGTQGGAIVGMKAQRHLLYCQLEHDFFYVNIANNLLRINEDGSISANPDFLGQTNTKIGNLYGVDMRDTNTLIFRDEWIAFIDTRRSAYCISNYERAEDISFGFTKGYWTEKLKHIADLRNQNQFTDAFLFLHSGFDPRRQEILTTSFGRVGSPADIAYANTENDYAIDLNETMSFNYASKYWSGTYGFTPELFIDFDSGAQGTQLISFVGGKPYLHHKIKSTGITFGNFYGVQCEPMIRFVMNGGEGQNLIQKRFCAMRIECAQSKWFAQEIFTQALQQSQIPIEAFEFGEQYTEGEILCDELTIQPKGLSALIDGDSLMGNWIKILMLIDPLNKDQYFELSAITISSTESY